MEMPVFDNSRVEEEDAWKYYQKEGWAYTWEEQPVKQWKDWSQKEHGAVSSFNPKAPPSSIGTPPCKGSTRAT
eukprot:10924638-Prorocentrum_lima.AAC.1